LIGKHTNAYACSTSTAGQQQHVKSWQRNNSASFTVKKRLRSNMYKLYDRNPDNQPWTNYMIQKGFGHDCTGAPKRHSNVI
jgi:hypothetical protein